MADISKLEQQADLLFNNVAGWENSTLQRIGKRIGKYGKMSLADVKAINNIAVVKQDMDAITKELAKVTGYNISQIEQMYGELLEEQHLANQPLYDYRGKKFVPFADNRELQAIARAYAKSTGETMINLAKTKALCILDSNGNVKGLQRAYTDVLDKAVMQVSTGATDFHTAMRDSIIELGGSGVRVDYGGGVTRRLDTVVRQNLLWGAKQASVEYNEMIGEELGCDGYEVDWHSNPRPSHEFMQGKQFVVGKARTINGVHFDSFDEAEERLQDYGCLHYKTPIICGISEPRYSPEELKRLNEQNARRYTIDGKEYSGYEVTQIQRRLESAVREQKTIRDTAKASGDNLLVRRCNERIKVYQDKYNQISEITGIEKQPKRMSVPKSKNVLTSDRTYSIINEAEKNLSELGIFKNKNELGKNMDDEYYSMVKEKFSHGSDVAKKVFNKFVPLNSISEYNRLGDAIYDTTTKKIYLNYMADLNNSRGNGITYFHEHAHLIDDFAGRPSRDNDFLVLLEEDKMNYMKLVIENQKIESVEEFNSFMNKELNDMRKHSGVSDIYDGLTLGEIRGVAYHPISYWEEVGNIEAEAFAHMFEAEFDNIKYREMKKYFPKSFEWFENKLKEMAK